ncbi:Crp/Fnr family transcriptional regulator [Flavobacterium sp. xlx-214]|uniref:Crp/Fnr family transcriptional regulator n=1 Tax=unclassified Flavobacterium TaxID=196869 RepID=UPI0013D87599|nr:MULTISPECIES: Crp/Fnr family transcriptional regulator [unclassified Flavobacterium]MBA5793054.1 Crp/Fnr family transcriptional regulator [Flavobacterium sp. xlx-221]QMI84618.1 Crp/Fnr family transcriptional regulator [Flavobacterium sp. xlx-214]
MHPNSNLFFNEPFGFSSENLRAILKPFKSSFKEIVLKKNDFLVKQGEICLYFCFIDEGVLRHTIEIDGQDKTTYLGIQNTVTVALNSFLLKQPSRKSIKALFDCRLWVMNLDDFLELRKTNSDFQKFYNNLIEKQLCLIDEYRLDLLTLSPEERYQKLLENEPKFIHDIPLHYLSSLLGISDRHMSRIRKNIK